MKTKFNISNTTALISAGLIFALAGGVGARDRFEYNPTPNKPVAPGGGGGGKSETPRGSALTLEAGEIREAFNASGSGPELAFYIPETRPTIVQVVIEKKIFHAPRYLVKGINSGSVTAAVVPRSLLDKTGLRPKNVVDEAKIQEALRNNPIRLVVK